MILSVVYFGVEIRFSKDRKIRVIQTNTWKWTITVPQSSKLKMNRQNPSKNPNLTWLIITTMYIMIMVWLSGVFSSDFSESACVKFVSFDFLNVSTFAEWISLFLLVFLVFYVRVGVCMWSNKFAIASIAMESHSIRCAWAEKKHTLAEKSIYTEVACTVCGDSIWCVANTSNTILVVTYDKQPHNKSHTNDRLYHGFDFRFLFTAHKRCGGGKCICGRTEEMQKEK